MKLAISVAIFAIMTALSLCLYGANSDVVILNSSNFQKEVLNSDQIWLVEFFGK